MGVYSYQLVFPDQTIVIDTALDEKGVSGHRRHVPCRRLRADGRGDGERHADRRHPRASRSSRRRPRPIPIPTCCAAGCSSPASRSRPPGAMAASPCRPASSPRSAPLEYEDYRAIAPGVVLIKAPGHSPGSQMIYVQRADGREFLFAGDIGWSLRNIEEVRSARAAGVAVHARRGSRRGLRPARRPARPPRRRARHRHRPGHDAAVIEALIGDRTMIEGFSVPVSP